MSRKRKNRSKYRGVALVISMVFVMVFSTLAIAIFTMSSTNTLAADNLHQANQARSAAESGLEAIRYYAEQISISGTLAPEYRFGNMAYQLVHLLDADNYPVYYDYTSTPPHIRVGFKSYPVWLSSSEDRSFYATITPDGTNGITIRVTGQVDSLDRTIESGFTYGTRPHSVFDYGVATKGALELDGGTLTSSMVKSESDVYIESLNNPKALGVLKNKSEISGVAKIVNADADIQPEDIKGLVGGLSGQEAIDESIEVGVAPTEFPYPNAAHFEQYVTGGTYTGGSTLDNVRIAAGTNPSFAGGTVINGILYIEAPNTVEFGGNVTVNGMIVCEGDWNDNSGTNSLAFTGSVDSYGLPEGSQYDGLRNETGTFIMAPGFDLSFWGSFGTINGAISGNGIQFGGNAGGVVQGSVINYSDTTMTVVGSSDIVFNRSGITEIPAGFVQDIVIYYDSTQYEEIP